jgi:biotin transport system substrate-specific component
MQHQTSPQVLANKFSRKKLLDLLYKFMLAVGGSFLIAIAAQIVVPLFPVPVTLQTLAVLFIAITCGSRVGTAAVAIYILEGASGLPVFAGGTGLLAGPSCGYLFGFLLTAFVSGYLCEHGWKRNFFTVFLAGFVGLLFTYAMGLAVLSLYVGWHSAITLGVVPFILAAILKLIFLATVISSLRKN